MQGKLFIPAFLQDYLISHSHYAAQVLALATDVPLTGLQHVKRVRKLPEAANGAAGGPMLQILLCRSTPALMPATAPAPTYEDAVLYEADSAAPDAAARLAAAAEALHRCSRYPFIPLHVTMTCIACRNKRQATHTL